MKKLFALINTQGKTKEQIIDETWEAYQNYSQAEKKIWSQKFRKPFLIITVVLLVLVGYFLVSKMGQKHEVNQDNKKAEISDTQQEEPTSRPVTAEELKELQADPSAPDWIKNAASCTWIGERVFCKLKGE